MIDTRELIAQALERVAFNNHCDLLTPREILETVAAEIREPWSRVPRPKVKKPAKKKAAR